MSQLEHLDLRGFEQTTEFSADEASARVYLDMDEDLPRVRFVWRPMERLFLLSDEDAEALVAAGFAPEVDGDGKRSIYLQQFDERNIALCNFRRYGWSWTDDPRGEHGYSHGVTYANSEIPIHFLAGTPFEVVRDALVATWRDLLSAERRYDFGRIFNTHAVHAVLTWLYRDAVVHVSRHAASWHGRRSYGQRSRFPIVVVKGGEARRFEPTLVEATSFRDWVLPADYLHLLLGEEDARVAEASSAPRRSSTLS